MNGVFLFQVWFQNARAKDKKSRHQRYVSEDSNCDDKTRDCSQSLVIKAAVELRDCQLCQLQQVNIHQHAFSAEHIGRVKALLERTQLIKSQQNQKLPYTNGNGSGGDSLDDHQQNHHAEENEENKQQQQHQNIGNIEKAAGSGSVANNGVIHKIFKSSSSSNLNQREQESSFLIYEKDAAVSNNLMLQINSAADKHPLDSDTVNAHAHTSDIIQQLFNNCNQMSGKFSSGLTFSKDYY